MTTLLKVKNYIHVHTYVHTYTYIYVCTYVHVHKSRLNQPYFWEKTVVVFKNEIYDS